MSTPPRIPFNLIGRFESYPTPPDPIGLEESRSPYSKSHERRLKRKAREQLVGGLKGIREALAAVEDDMPVAVQASVADVELASAEEAVDPPRPKKVKPKPGQIGEGKGVPLSKNQRKRALYVTRCPLLSCGFVAICAEGLPRRQLSQPARTNAHSHDTRHTRIRGESLPDAPHACPEHPAQT